jgi:LemA protein
MTPLMIVIVALVVVLLWFILTYNSFIRLVNRGKEAWADIDVQLKRRYDLIPNLIQTVKGYALHESQVFDNVTKARSAAMGAGSLPEKGEAENMLKGALKSLFAVAEAYPDLKANQNFLRLEEELSDTENKIQAARRFYNTVVRDLNTKTDSFPSNLVAGLFHLSKMEYFQLENAAEREAVPVEF